MNDLWCNDLATEIWGETQFREDYRNLYVSSIYKSLGVDATGIQIGKEVVQRLLQTAAILSLSKSPEYRQAAYKIAIACLNIEDAKLDNLPNIIYVILGRLGNFPALAHLEHSLSNQNLGNAIPATLLLELIGHATENLSRNGKCELTDFQKSLSEKLYSDKLLSVTAPTSAGKSFVLQEHLLEQIEDGTIKKALYVVPTRALLAQVAEIFIKHTDSKTAISTIPLTPEELGSESVIYILTPERTHLLLKNVPTLSFELVIIDEAQTIGSGSRGVLLQTVIELLIRRNPLGRFFFGSPFAANPDHFKYLFDTELKSIKETDSPVSQNFVYLDTSSSSPNEIVLGVSDPISGPQANIKVSMDEMPDPAKKAELLAFFARRFGSFSKSIVYGGSPSACENIAKHISSNIEKASSANTQAVPEDIKELAAFIREHIHPDYCLAGFIEKGVAFHFGNIPSIIRKAVEDAFADSPYMKYLVCTSTLLHGVNLPAQNMFMLCPNESGKWGTPKARPITPQSFRNLAGRAGRLTKDFYGNVFMINKSEWETDPLADKEEAQIKSSLYDALRDNNLCNKVILLAKGEDKFSNTPEARTIESIFVKLYSEYARGRLDVLLSRSPNPIDTGFIAAIKDVFAKISITVPKEIIESNPGISLYRQEKLLTFFNQAIADGKAESLIPLHPAVQDSYESYVLLIETIGKHFDPGLGMRASWLAVLAIRWMRGEPYSQLIASEIEYLKEKQNGKRKSKVEVVIRSIISTVEKDLRFELVQYTRCYSDLLQYALSSSGNEALLSKIPTVALYLEVGACSDTMLNLVAMGFSRTTATIISKRLSSNRLARNECVEQLKSVSWDKVSIPKLCLKEIKTILRR